ncbi:MAG: thioredoxin [Pedobacter sp.]|nr:MAG: thioredoxin [Pedobacter sp.]
MKHFLGTLFLLVITATGFATEISFQDNPTWASVLEQAKKDKKIIFFDAYATWCGPCKKMDAETYKDQAVADFYNANFINVKFDMEKGEGPKLAEQYQVTAYPTFLFIGADGQLLHKGLGFIEPNAFVALGKEGINPDEQYYALKSKALQMSNAEFAKFATQAVQMRDEAFPGVATEYLEKQADILGNKDLIALVMNEAVSLSDEKALAYVINNKEKITATGMYPPAEVEQRLIALMFSYALSPEQQTSDDQLDFEVVKSVLDKYAADKSFFLFNFFKTQYYIGEKEIDSAVTSLDLLISSVSDKVSIDQVSNAMLTAGPSLAQGGKLDATLKKFDSMKAWATVPDMIYMKDFVKAVIYIKSNDVEKFKEIANAMVASATTPQNVKDDLKSALERM